MGVDYAQGFHLGRPAPLAKWLIPPRSSGDHRQRARRHAPPSRGVSGVQAVAWNA
jgi:hypothetical protein